MIEGKLPYRGYTIQPKLDFGNKPFLINGKLVGEGLVVTDGICNVMPGATWFQTWGDAIRAIDILIEVDGDSDMFWEKWRTKNESSTSETGIV